MEIGFISMRNEDGTWWIGREGTWRYGRVFRAAHPIETFREWEGRVEESQKRDGFHGIWNLKWHPCTVEEATAAERKAREWDQKSDEEEAELENRLEQMQKEEDEIND